ncbi:MAG: 16S rRNA (guanine(527)-N(7))-methyltransferase RsmG [Alphaproteobacteria bacterium]|nr:16S rRNA (guanine(527)-N(7))-methyltransferase RsmG [Alphaproteobacteria bacterium]
MAPFGPKDFAAKTNVSQETLTRLKLYASLLEDWNARHNLVAKSTLPDLWRRHFWDSAQLEPLIPENAKTLADLGSGAGFPGLVLAAMQPDIAVTLHEATTKKCAFLDFAAERMGAAVRIVNRRLEDLPPQQYDVVTARALAPLPQLLAYAKPLTGPNSVCLFLKGQNLGSELTEAHKSWKMETSQVPSQTDSSGAILVVRKLIAVHDTPSPKAARVGRRQSERRRR